MALPFLSFSQLSGAVRKIASPIGRLGRGSKHMLRHAQPGGDVESAALPCLPDDHLIGGLQTFPVKGHPGIDKPLRSSRVLFHLRIMGGHQKQASALLQFLHDGHGDTHTLRRIRA